MGRRCQPWVGQLLFLSVALAGTPSVVSADPVSLAGSTLVNWDGNCAGVAIKDGGFRLCLADLIAPVGTIQTTGPGDASAPMTAVGDVTGVAGALYPAELTGGGFFTDSRSASAGTLVADFEMNLRITGTLITSSGLPFFSAGFPGQSVPAFVVERFANGSVASGNPNISFESDNVPSPNPEPATMLLLGTGLAGLALRARSRRRT
jgi:PEP-CTERM motif-containing protein